MDINYTGILPEIILSLVGISIMLLIPFLPRERQTHLGYLALAGLVLAFFGVAMGWQAFSSKRVQNLHGSIFQK